METDRDVGRNRSAPPRHINSFGSHIGTDPWRVDGFIRKAERPSPTIMIGKKPKVVSSTRRRVRRVLKRVDTDRKGGTPKQSRNEYKQRMDRSSHQDVEERLKVLHSLR